MLGNLLEAIKKDLDVYPIRSKTKLNAYARWLFGEAYVCKNGKTNTHLYAKIRDEKNIDKEIRSMVYKGNLMIDYNMFLDSFSNVTLNYYINQKGLVIQSFNDA